MKFVDLVASCAVSRSVAATLRACCDEPGLMLCSMQNRTWEKPIYQIGFGLVAELPKDQETRDLWMAGEPFYTSNPNGLDVHCCSHDVDKRLKKKLRELGLKKEIQRWYGAMHVLSYSPLHPLTVVSVDRLTYPFFDTPLTRLQTK